MIRPGFAQDLLEITSLAGKLKQLYDVWGKVSRSVFLLLLLLLSSLNPSVKAVETAKRLSPDGRCCIKIQNYKNKEVPAGTTNPDDRRNSNRIDIRAY